jgi:hypothetical protein
MVPTTLLGLLLFVVLITPGFIYQLRLERTLAIGRESALREVLRIILSSLVCGGVVFAAAAVIRVRRPSATPDVGGLVRSPHEYAQQHYRLVGAWFLALLGAACLLAFILADPRIRRLGGWLASHPPFRWLLLNPDPSDIHPDSAWYRLLHLYDHAKPLPTLYVGCELEDGTYVSGELFTLSPAREESADRDLALTAPILHRTKDGRITELKGIGATVISARRIIRLDFSHLGDGVPPPQPPTHRTAMEPTKSRLRRLGL